MSGNKCKYFKGLSWDAGLKLTEAKFENIQDYDMMLFINKALRGGYSLVAQSYARANIQNSADFKPNQDQSCILNLDANNLYGL